MSIQTNDVNTPAVLSKLQKIRNTFKHTAFWVVVAIYRVFAFIVSMYNEHKPSDI